MTWRKDNRLALENDLPRADIVEKVTGRARYTTDHYPPGMLWAGYLRCPYGKARLIAVEEDAARSVPGVLDLEITKREGNYAGDRLGHLCAESREAYEEAMRVLDLKFETSRARTNLAEERSPLKNFDDDDDDHETLTDAFSDEAAIVEATYQTEVQVHCCLEPHIGIVDYRGDHAVVRGSTQGTFSLRDGLDDVLDLRPEQVECHCEYVGGGFGSKLGSGAEAKLAARMSKKHGRPCRVGLNRKEELQDAGMRPGSMQYVKAAANRDGRVVGARIHTWGSVGPGGGGGGVKFPKRYDFGYVVRTHEDVHLNGGYPRAMRAPGHPQGMFGEAMILDELAASLGMDPLGFRKMNDPNATRQAMYDVGAELIGWGRRKSDGAGTEVLKRGFGIGAGDWGNRPGRATVEVRLHRSGHVEVFSGSQDIGTGFRTVMRDTVAHQLGIPGDRVTALVGVSTYPYGPASGGSVTSRMTAPKAFGAAEQAKAELLQLVAEEWDIASDMLTSEDGRVTAGDRSMSWEDACRLIRGDHITGQSSKDGNFWSSPTKSEAVQFAEVEVDVETGKVRVVQVVALQEMGQAVNRMTAENQICGGVVQGLSFALFEQRILERQTGAMINADLAWYKVAGPVDVPEIRPVIWQSREDCAVNSLGEPPVIPTAGAIGCAVANAIGVPVRQLPLTPRRVLAALGDVKS